LSMLRLVCENGMVAMAPAFRSAIQLGQREDAPEIPLQRAIASFDG